jgi:hypothetical protein
MKIGSKVLMKVSDAKWHLDHPEIYQKPSGGMDVFYETEVLIHLMCAIGVPVLGTVIKKSTTEKETYLIRFEVANLSTTYYLNKKNFLQLSKRSR